MTRDEVAAFWGWFRTIAADLEKRFEDVELLRELDDRVAALGLIAWEIGPGLVEPNALSLSPGGDRQLLALTERIIEGAPRLAGWEFHSAKPPKKWKLRFEVEDEAGNRHALDASKWRYELRPDRTIAISGTDLLGLDPAYARWAAEIALDGMLGERERLLRFEEVVIETTPRPSAQPFIHLAGER